jgi:ethanolamine utilization protein EutN
MKLARVRGTIVATIKHPAYEGRTILLCQPLTPDGRDKGDQVIAVDHVQAGEGDLVLILTEGNGVRQILGADAGPIRSVIVGIVDEVSAS